MKEPHYFVFCFFAGSLLMGWFFALESHPKGNYEELIHQAESQILQIQVDGAVVNPGVYSLDEDCRVLDALTAAGGLLPDADWFGINQAARLYNLQKIEIPYLSSTPSHDQIAGDIAVSANTPTSTLDGIAQIPVFEETPLPDSALTMSNSCPEEAIGSGIFTWPTANHSLSGNDYSYDHPGIDLAAGEESPVYATDSGMIRLAGNDNSGYGNIIEIDHGNGYSTVYAHLSVIGVEAGQGVCTGEWIGAAGSTGKSTGAHLHFEVIQDGGYINPWSVLPMP